MALLFMDGFDHYATADITKKWTSIGSGAAPTIQPSGGRRGGGCMRLTYSSFNCSASKAIPASGTVIVGFAFKIDSFTSLNSNGLILTLSDGATVHIQLKLNNVGNLIVLRNTTVLATSSNAISIGTFYYIELKVKIDDTVGTYDVVVNTVNWLSGSGADTRNGGNASVNSVMLSSPGGGANLTTDFDDLYVCDTSGSINNDFLGDVRIDTLLPTGDGTYTDFTPNSGSAHWSRVAEGAPDTSTYVTSATSGNKDTYQFGDLTAVTGTIMGVQVNNAALKDDSGTRSIANVVRSGSTDAVSATVALSTGQLIYTSIHETDPNTSAAWTEAGVNGAQFGVKVAA